MDQFANRVEPKKFLANIEFQTDAGQDATDVGHRLSTAITELSRSTTGSPVAKSAVVTVDPGRGVVRLTLEIKAPTWARAAAECESELTTVTRKAGLEVTIEISSHQNKSVKRSRVQSLGRELAIA